MIRDGEYDCDEQSEHSDNSALHLAVRACLLETVRTLVFEFGANPELKNKREKSALELAQEMPEADNRRETMLRLLSGES